MWNAGSFSAKCEIFVYHSSLHVRSDNTSLDYYDMPEMQFGPIYKDISEV